MRSDAGGARGTGPVGEPAGRGAPAGATRERLITAAREVICEMGLKQARMEDIAARAGVSRAAVYYHFNAKSDLVAAIVDDVCAGLTDIVRATLADGPMDAVIPATVGFFADHVAVVRLLLTEMTLPADPLRLVSRHRDALLSVLRRRVTADIAAGRMRSMDPDVAAQAIVGIIGVAPVEMICNEATGLEHLAAQLTEFLRHALALSP